MLLTRRLCIFQCVLLMAVVSLAAASPSFDDFCTECPPGLQEQIRSLWQQSEPSQQPPDSAPEEITDEQLFDALTVENTQDTRDKLTDLRAKLSVIRTKHAGLRRSLDHWTAFNDRLAEIPEMTGVHLESAKIVDQLQSRLQDTESTASSIEKEIQSLRAAVSLDEISTNFTRRDWAVVFVYLAFTTVLGGLLAGKQSSMKDFFLGGRKLPWPAVCGSIIATELSAATFLIAPAIVFSQGGDMTYIQLALGTILARFVIGYYFIPAYYKREIYSPYDYMGNQLGSRVKHITTALFMIGGILAQGARVYIAAKALQVITGTDTTTSIIIIGAVSIVWTIMGGITTVIWTDAIQFVLFAAGAVAALVFAASAIDGGIATIVSEAHQAGKLKTLNLTFDPKQAYTLWCALVGFSCLTLASHGTDQLLVQRMFTCKNESAARKAIIFSGFSQVLTYLLLFVGAGIFVYYKHSPLSAPEQVVIDADSMKVFAIYIVDVMPPLLSGLLMAAIFATAISTLDSLLAALSQSTISIFYKPRIKPNASDAHYVRASRVVVFIWGILLTAFAIYCDVIAQRYADLIQFALAMAAYTYGALLGVFLLAFLPTRRDDLGLMWGVPISVLTVFALNWHQPIPQTIVALASALMLIQAFRKLRQEPQKILYIAIAIALLMTISMAVVQRNADSQPVYITLAWPWHFPIATAVTFLLGYMVGNETQKQ